MHSSKNGPTDYKFLIKPPINKNYQLWNVLEHMNFQLVDAGRWV